MRWYITVTLKNGCFCMARLVQMAKASSLASRQDHTQKHHAWYDSSGRVISSSQIPPPDNTRHAQQTNIRAPGGIRARNPSKRAATDP